MANPELGAKQICPTCSTKFYDLTRRPAVCPKCGNAFDPEEALRNRRVRVRAPLPEDQMAGWLQRLLGYGVVYAPLPPFI